MVIEQQAPSTGARRRRWTREEYYRMAEVGILGERERVELIEGEIVELAPESAPHGGITEVVIEILRLAFGAGFAVRGPHPLKLDGAEPEPDIAVVRGAHRDYLREHPTAAVLVVEVSRSTLVYDRTNKVAIYARAGVPDYWIINLVDQQLEVHRDPGELVDGTFGYRTRQMLGRGQTVQPLAKPGVEIAINDLLP